MIRFPIICDKRKCVVKLKMKDGDVVTPFREPDGKAVVFDCSHDAGIAVAAALQDLHLLAMAGGVPLRTMPSVMDFSIEHVVDDGVDTPVEDMTQAADFLSRLMKKGQR